MDSMSRSDRATFRLPPPALFFPVVLLFCVIPLATVGGAWGLMFAVPVLALAWLLITRTTATTTAVTAHGLRGSRRMKWPDLDTLEFPDGRWAVAVGTDGRRLRLPNVRPRDLPRLVAVAGGSLTFTEPAGSAPDAPDAPESPDSPDPSDSADSPDPAESPGHSDSAESPHPAESPEPAESPGHSDSTDRSDSTDHSVSIDRADFPNPARDLPAAESTR